MNNETQETATSASKKSPKLDMAQLTTLIMPLARFIRRHLVIFFISLTLSALIYAVMSVNGVLQDTTASEETSATTYSTNFDRTIILKIEALNRSSQAPTVALPPGRINPFAE